MDKKNIKIFAFVSAFATLCITFVALYAVKEDAAWASVPIVVGIVSAFITIAVPVVNKIHGRIQLGRNEYEMKLHRYNNFNDHPVAQQEKSYYFSLTKGQFYEFQDMLPGANSCAYTFKISEIWVMYRAVKFAIEIYRHEIGEEPQIITDRVFELRCDECLPIDGEQLESRQE